MKKRKPILVKFGLKEKKSLFFTLIKMLSKKYVDIYLNKNDIRNAHYSSNNFID